MKMGPSWSYCS